MKFVDLYSLQMTQISYHGINLWYEARHQHDKNKRVQIGHTPLSVVASLSETLLWLNAKSSDPTPPKKIPPGPPGDK